MGGGKLFRNLRHAMTMVGRTIRSYALLSVTIVLSFVLLLGYLGYVDTTLYNEYKGIFKINRGTVTVIEGLTTPQKFNTLLEKSRDLQDTAFYFTNTTSTVSVITNRMATDNGDNLGGITASVCVLTGRAWHLFDQSTQVIWFDGQTHEDIYLKGNEVILDWATFQALGLDAQSPYYTFLIAGQKREVRIVGVADYGGSLLTTVNGRVAYDSNYRSKLFISSELLTDSELESYFPSRTAVFYSAEPEKLAALAEELDIPLAISHTIYKAQDEALEKIQTQKGTKGIVVCALLVLLGVNLYSSFSNALNERKFEIGVKRAIGASSFSIVRQFLYESLLVMAVNILVSIGIVVDLGLVWKLIMEQKYAEQSAYMDKYGDFILYISPHSAAMFAICSVTLTVVFSLIFAYKSTQVEIVQYLKAE